MLLDKNFVQAAYTHSKVDFWDLAGPTSRLVTQCEYLWGFRNLSGRDENDAIVTEAETQAGGAEQSAREYTVSIEEC